MTEFVPWILGIAVVAVVGGVVWYTFGRQQTTSRDDDYLRALEFWVDGDSEQAATLLRRVVHDDPSSVDPYLHLGNLLRLQGDAERAALLHRSLTVRPNLPRPKRISVGLALATDLIDLERWAEANQVLDTLVRDASDRRLYWISRFAAWYGQDNLPDAARALKAARSRVAEKDRSWFEQAYACFQLDRALSHVLAGEPGEARARLKDVAKIPEAQTRAKLVTALLAVSEGDTAAAVTLASEDLLDSPAELQVLLPALQDLLLAQGQYARSIPILERACQAEAAPPTLWIALALLYEKIGEREKAMRLLAGKAQHEQLTPDLAAPYLRLLVSEAEGSDFARVWNQLTVPRGPGWWTCCNCGHREDRLRWFCPECRGI